MSDRASRLRELRTFAATLADYAEQAGVPGAVGLGIATEERLVVLVHEAEYDAVQEAVATYAQQALTL